MKTSLKNSPFRNTLYTLTCLRDQPFETIRVRITLIVASFTTIEKVSKKPTPSTWRKPLAISLPLYLSKVLSTLSFTLNTCLHPMTCLSISRAINSQASLTKRASISSNIIYLYFGILRASLYFLGVGNNGTLWIVKAYNFGLETPALDWVVMEWGLAEFGIKDRPTLEQEREFGTKKLEGSNGISTKRLRTIEGEGQTSMEKLVEEKWGFIRVVEGQVSDWIEGIPYWKALDEKNKNMWAIYKENRLRWYKYRCDSR